MKNFLISVAFVFVMASTANAANAGVIYDRNLNPLTVHLTGLDGIKKKYDHDLKNGKDIVLTIDQHIQSIAQAALDDMYQRSHSKDASIIIMDPRTGEVLALVNDPEDSAINYALTPAFEPGSVFKFVLASAALQEGIVKEDEVINCEKGAYQIAPGRILHDYEPFDQLTFKKVIEESSNIGTTKVSQRLGLAKLYKYIQLFRFGRSTGIDLPDEASGELKPVRLWTKTAFAAVPIGQEVPVTPIQLVGAMSAIANNGVYMQPFVIKSLKEGKRTIRETKPKAIGRVITPQTAQRIKVILQGVIEEGTGFRARIKGVPAAGKTGTSQKIVDGKYSHKYFYADFAGFAPVDNPRLSIVIIFDEPHPYYYGAEIAAPVFGEVLGTRFTLFKKS